MIANRNFGQYEPLTWVGRFPIYLSTALALAHAAALVLVLILMTWGFKAFVGDLIFSTTSAIGSLHLWQFVTYAFIYDQPKMYLVTLIQLYMLATFGQEVEKFIGRKQFALMYVALVLAVPIYLTIMSFGERAFAISGSTASSAFAVFVAFVLIYPRVQIFFSIEARWIGLILFAGSTVQFAAVGDMTGLGAFWVECAVAGVWMAKEGVQGLSLPSLPSFKSFAAKQHSKKNLKIVRREIQLEPEEEPNLHDSIDPILDKIAKSGIGSLTRSEREKLERARVALLEKEGRR